VTRSAREAVESTGTRSRRLHTVLIAVCSLAAADVWAQHPVGPEFQVNTFTTDNQSFPVVALDATGSFVVAWQSALQDGFGGGVFARRFDASGKAQSAELRASTLTATDADRPAVAMDADGDFIVVWEEERSVDEDVFARRYDRYGVPQGPDLLVNTHTGGAQITPAVAMHDDGNFMVVWNGADGYGAGTFAQRFDSLGLPLGFQFQINSSTQFNQQDPSIAANPADGGYVIAWQGFPQDGSYSGIFARRIALFSFVGEEFQVNTFTPGRQLAPQVDVASDGRFAVVWTSIGQDGSEEGVFGRRFDPSGQAQAVEFRVNVHTQGAQEAPGVAFLANGSFAVVWHDADGQDGETDGVFSRRYDSAGVAVTGDQQVNTYTTNRQSNPTIAAGGGDFVITWSSLGQDPDLNGVFAQRYATALTIDVDGDGAVLPLTDALLILRSAFGFTGNTLVTGAVNLAGCTRCTAPEIEAFLDALY
jgi:phosphoheptose isomerase